MSHILSRGWWSVNSHAIYSLATSAYVITAFVQLPVMVRCAQPFWYAYTNVYIVCARHDNLCMRCAQRIPYILHVRCTIYCTCDVRTAQWFWYVFIACAMRDNWCMTCAICSTNTIYVMLVWCTIYCTCDVQYAQRYWYVYNACVMRENLCMQCAYCSMFLICIYCMCDAR